MKRRSVAMPVPLYRLSVTVPAQGFANLGRLGIVNAGGTSQIPLAFVAHSGSQMARSRLAMLHLAGRRNAKPFLGTLVGLLLRHD